MADVSLPESLPGEPPHKPRRWREIFIWLAGLALLFGGAFWYLYLHDEPPPDDADLCAAGPMVPDDKNGERFFEGETKGRFDLDAYADAQGVDEGDAYDILAGRQFNDAFVAGYLAQVQPCLAQIEAALAQPFFEFSHPLNIQTLTLPRISLMMTSARTLLMAARQAAAHGDYAFAVREIALAEELARRIAESHGGILYMLVAVTIDGMAQKLAVNFLNNPQVPLAVIDSLPQAFQPEINWTPAYQQALRLEYQFFISGLASLQQDPKSISKFTTVKDSWVAYFTTLNLKPNQTRRFSAETLREGIKAAELDYAALHHRYPAKLDSEADLDSTWKVFLPNGGGRLLHGLTTIRIYDILTTKQGALAGSRLLQIGLAMRHYYDDHLALPAKLDGLVPQFLSAVPLDPYNSQPLLYDAARGLIYSVGTSLEDNGGSKFLKMAKDGPNYEDPFSDKQQPTLQLEFQKPAPAITTPANSAK